jgi:hypothetical protein
VEAHRRAVDLLETIERGNGRFAPQGPGEEILDGDRASRAHLLPHGAHRGRRVDKMAEQEPSIGEVERLAGDWAGGVG